jgi:hypothetical protein
MRRLESSMAWFFTCLGIVLLAASPLVVPANLFADAGSDCRSQYGSNGSLDGTCCYAACGSDYSCGFTCCQIACNYDTTCVSACTSAFAAAQQPCGNAQTCNPANHEQCWYSNNLNRCTINGDTGPGGGAMNDVCYVTGFPATCGGCKCLQFPDGQCYCTK